MLPPQPQTLSQYAATHATMHTTTHATSSHGKAEHSPPPSPSTVVASPPPSPTTSASSHAFVAPPSPRASTPADAVVVVAVGGTGGGGGGCDRVASSAAEATVVVVDDVSGGGGGGSGCACEGVEEKIVRKGGEGAALSQSPSLELSERRERSGCSSVLRRRLKALHERYGEFAEENGYVRCEDKEVSGVFFFVLPHAPTATIITPPRRRRRRRCCCRRRNALTPRLFAFSFRLP